MKGKIYDENFISQKYNLDYINMRMADKIGKVIASAMKFI